MNEFSGKTSVAHNLAELMDENEHAAVRCIATTFETRPDWCREEHINRMLDLGVTKVELGFQHTDEELLTKNKRGHTVADSVEANRLLRDAGIKVGFHVMPNLYGSSIPRDRKMFDILFTDPRFCPDFLKIYPTLVTPGAELEELWKSGEYETYDEDDLIDLLAYAKERSATSRQNSLYPDPYTATFARWHRNALQNKESSAIVSGAVRLDEDPAMHLLKKNP